MTTREAANLAKNTLSPKRFIHVKNVAAAARELAIRYRVDPDKAELAAWLHDVVKEQSREDLLQILSQDAIMAGPTEKRPFPIWHGPCAAIYACHDLGVKDEDVLSAIACHTTGKKNMTTLDKVIFLADVISAERTYPGVKEIRRLAKQDLDKAVVAAMEQNIDHLKKCGKPIDADTMDALLDLKKDGGEVFEPRKKQS